MSTTDEFESETVSIQIKSANYYKIHAWIEYSCINDSVYCFACRHFCGLNLFKGEKENFRTQGIL